MEKTIKEVTKVIQQYIDEEKADNLLFEEVKKALRPFIGKPYNKRMETAVKKHFGDEYFIYIERIASLINLKIKGPWKGQSDYRLQNGHSMLIGYNTTETYQEGDGTRELSGINYFSLCYGNAALERIEKNEKILKSKVKIEKLARAIELLKESKKILESSDLNSFNFPARYEIERKFKLRDER